MKKQNIQPQKILFFAAIITALIGCTPEPEFKLTKPLSLPLQISSLEAQKPIIGDNSFNSTPNLLTDIKTLNVTDPDSDLSDLRVFFDGDKLKNKKIITNSNGVSLEITCGGETGIVNPLQCQFAVKGKTLINASETFITNFQVRDITLNKEGKDISNTSEQGKILITFSRDSIPIDAKNTLCNFVINSREASCDISDFTALDSLSNDILVSIINSETNMQDKIICAKIIDAQKLKIRCTLKLLNELKEYPLSKKFSATFNLTNTSNSKLSMKDSKTITYSFSRSPIVYTKKQSFTTFSKFQVPAVDFLWVVDNSGSMAKKQLALINNFESLINTFIPLENNVRTAPFPFRMTAITTDAYLKSELCSLEKCSPEGNPLLVNDSLALSNYDLFSKNFKSIVQVGTKGNASERSIESINAYIKAVPTAFNLKNLLVVIFLTDEVEQSYKTAACPLDNFTPVCNLERVKWSIGQIGKLKANKDLLKVFSIVNFAADGSNVYKELSNEFAGISQSINDPFSSILENIGASITNSFLEYTLSFQGKVKSIKSVTVDGKLLPNVKNNDYIFVAPNKIRVKKLPAEGKTMIVEFEYSNDI